MTTQFPVYLDYAATTPIDPRVAERMIDWLTRYSDRLRPSVGDIVQSLLRSR